MLKATQTRRVMSCSCVIEHSDALHSETQSAYSYLIKLQILQLYNHIKPYCNSSLFQLIIALAYGTRENLISSGHCASPKATQEAEVSLLPC